MVDMEAYRLLNKSLNFSMNFDADTNRTSLKLFETTSEFHNFSVTLKFDFGTYEDGFNLQLTNGKANVFGANYGSDFLTDNYRIYYKKDVENEKYIYYITHSRITSLTSATISISIENGVIDHNSILAESQEEVLETNILSFNSYRTSFNNVLGGESKVSHADYATNAGNATKLNNQDAGYYATSADVSGVKDDIDTIEDNIDYIQSDYLPLGGTSALTGDIVPSTNNTKNLGSSQNAFANVYATKLHATKLYGNLTSDGITYVSGREINLSTSYGDIKILSGKDIKVSSSIIPETSASYNLGSADNTFGTVYATKFTGDLEGNADTATKATNDINGNPIAVTYLTKQNTETLGDILIPDNSSYKISSSFYIGKYGGQNSVYSKHASYVHSDTMLMLEGSTNKIEIDNDSITSSIEIREDSDLRDKIDINDIDDSKTLQFIKLLNPVTYNYNNRSRYNLETEYEEYLKGTKKLSNKSAGFIAQDVERVFKDIYGDETNNTIVSKDNQGDYGLRYSNFTPYLVSAIQEQQKMIETLQNEIQSLKEQINLLNKNEE